MSFFGTFYGIFTFNTNKKPDFANFKWYLVERIFLEKFPDQKTGVYIFLKSKFFSIDVKFCLLFCWITES